MKHRLHQAGGFFAINGQAQASQLPASLYPFLSHLVIVSPSIILLRRSLNSITQKPYAITQQAMGLILLSQPLYLFSDCVLRAVIISSPIC